MLHDRPLDAVYDLSRPREGGVDRWIAGVVWVAMLATFVVLFVGPRIVWSHDDQSIGVPAFWFKNALAIGFVVTALIAWIPPARGSRIVRLAVILPIVQIIAMSTTWLAWVYLRPQLPSAADSTPIFTQLPVHVVLPALAVAVPCAALIVTRPNKREWLHATVMLALVFVLALGLWLPFAAGRYDGVGWESWIALERALLTTRGMIAFVVGPPMLAAMLITAIALRWPSRIDTRATGAVLAVITVAACAYRSDVGECGAFVYINFIHVIACAALVAVAAIVTLGIATWIGNARARRILDETALVGTITGSRHVAALELTSWLRGPAPLCDAFSVQTPHGEVPVPAGARVIAPTPLATTLLRTGEAVGTLRGGDRVALAGYVAGHSDGPFRSTSAPVPGADGITVGRGSDERYGASHVVLDLWRPSIAYLLICVAVALPGLAALFSDRF